MQFMSSEELLCHQPSKISYSLNSIIVINTNLKPYTVAETYCRAKVQSVLKYSTNVSASYYQLKILDGYVMFVVMETAKINQMKYIVISTVNN